MKPPTGWTAPTAVCPPTVCSPPAGWSNPAAGPPGGSGAPPTRKYRNLDLGAAAGEQGTLHFPQYLGTGADLASTSCYGYLPPMDGSFPPSGWTMIVPTSAPTTEPTMPTIEAAALTCPPEFTDIAPGGTASGKDKTMKVEGTIDLFIRVQEKHCWCKVKTQGCVQEACGTHATFTHSGAMHKQPATTDPTPPTWLPAENEGVIPSQFIGTSTIKNTGYTAFFSTRASGPPTDSEKPHMLTTIHGEYSTFQDTRATNLQAIVDCEQDSAIANVTGGASSITSDSRLAAGCCNPLPTPCPGGGGSALNLAIVGLSSSQCNLTLPMSNASAQGGWTAAKYIPGGLPEFAYFAVFVCILLAQDSLIDGFACMIVYYLLIVRH